MKITLNTMELNDYNVIISTIPTLPKGTHIFFRDFFIGRSASQRVARKLREDVGDGTISGIALAGTKSHQGYIIT